MAARFTSQLGMTLSLRGPESAGLELERLRAKDSNPAAALILRRSVGGQGHASLEDAPGACSLADRHSGNLSEVWHDLNTRGLQPGITSPIGSGPPLRQSAQYVLALNPIGRKVRLLRTQSADHLQPPRRVGARLLPTGRMSDLAMRQARLRLILSSLKP
jgi:hypothetical protein